MPGLSKPIWGSIMLRLDGVSLHYGGFCALNAVSMTVGAGELVVLLGANGAGKSSLFLTISGLLRPSSGQIEFEGQAITAQSPASIVGRGVVQCPEGRKLFPELSVRKNLLLGGYVHARDHAGTRQRLEQVFEMFPALQPRQDTPAGALSGGQQQMVAIGRALMGRPRLLLLDEPSLGLAPLVVKQMLEIVSAINAAGTTVLLAEQNAHAALRIAHRAYVLESGQLTTEGAPDALLGDERIRKAYIGA